MARVLYDKDADLDLIRAKKVAIVGYGSQGHAHALNLTESGVAVRVGLPEGSKSRPKAEAAGIKVGTVNEVAEWADTVMILAPDTSQPKIYTQQIEPHLRPGKTLMFAHGFNIHFGTIKAPAAVAVSLIAPKSPGHRVRETFQAGGGVPALLAVHQDPQRHRRGATRSRTPWASARPARACSSPPSRRRPRPISSASRPSSAAGPASWSRRASQTLVDAGYQPEIAYFECLHELKLIVDLMYRGGLNYMRYSVSDTAEYGDYVAGKRIINEGTRAEMKKILARDQERRLRQGVDRRERGRPAELRARAPGAARAGHRGGGREPAQDDALPGPRNHQARGLTMPHVDHVRIFDTTLRDGEQAPGAALTPAHKLEIARALARLRVDVIEAGFPASSPGDFAAVRSIAEEVGSRSPDGVEPPVICGLARATGPDIERCWQAIQVAARPRIHTFMATSPILMEAKLNMTPDQVRARVAEMVGHARSLTADVEFSAEDAGRSDPAFLYEVIDIAIRAGATTINIPDTVGLLHARGVRRAHPRRARERLRQGGRRLLRPLPRRFSGWRRPTPWPGSAPAPARSRWPSTASASAPAIAPSRRW